MATPSRSILIDFDLVFVYVWKHFLCYGDALLERADWFLRCFCICLETLLMLWRCPPAAFWLLFIVFCMCARSIFSVMATPFRSTLIAVLLCVCIWLDAFVELWRRPPRTFWHTFTMFFCMFGSISMVLGDALPLKLYYLCCSVFYMLGSIFSVMAEPSQTILIDFRGAPGPHSVGLAPR